MRLRRAITLGTALLLAVLFIAPIRSYRSAQQHLSHAQAQIAAAVAQRDALTRQLQDANTRHAMVEQARALGYVFPGETPYVVLAP